MALIQEIFCSCCGEIKEVNTSGLNDLTSICHECSSKQSENERQAHLDALAAMPITDRIANIEAWIYDYERRPREPFLY